MFTLGNGGSASTAQHFACDLAKFVIPAGQRPFDVRCLTDNVSLYTAWANDADRSDVFVNLMRGLIRSGDVVIACSVHGGQGFSADLVRGIRFANTAAPSTISLVGFDGGMMHVESTVSILVPVDSTPQVEAIHLVVEHLLMAELKQVLETPICHPSGPRMTRTARHCPKRCGAPMTNDFIPRTHSVSSETSTVMCRYRAWRVRSDC